MRIFLLPALLFLFSCDRNTPDGAAFSEVPRSRTGIDFRNLVIEKETFNIFKYQYFYNGGGTAVGDFNNDGLQDLVFTGNMVKNRLYLNRGDFEFEDVTKTSGIADHEGWIGVESQPGRTTFRIALPKAGDPQTTHGKDR